MAWARRVEWKSTGGMVAVSRAIAELFLCDLQASFSRTNLRDESTTQRTDQRRASCGADRRWDGAWIRTDLRARFGRDMDSRRAVAPDRAPEPERRRTEGSAGRWERILRVGCAFREREALDAPAGDRSSDGCAEGCARAGGQSSRSRAREGVDADGQRRGIATFGSQRSRSCIPIAECGTWGRRCSSCRRCS
jgi:hypothetical protein